MEITGGMALASLECHVVNTLWLAGPETARRWPPRVPSRVQLRAAMAMIVAWCLSCERGESTKGLVDAALRRASTMTEAESLIAMADYVTALRLMRQEMDTRGDLT